MPPWHLSVPPLIHEVVSVSNLYPSNSENFPQLNFLEEKDNRKKDLALWHLVNRLVQENVNKCNKMHIKHVTNDII